MAIRIEDLDGVKLVNEENFAPEARVLNVLEEAYMQGSQGWGVTPETAIILHLVRVLRDALALADVSEERQRMLKGAQMELGRVKKARDDAKAQRDELAQVLNDATEAAALPAPQAD